MSEFTNPNVDGNGFVSRRQREKASFFADLLGRFRGPRLCRDDENEGFRPNVRQNPCLSGWHVGRYAFFGSHGNYLRGRLSSQCKLNTVPGASLSQAATSFAWKGRSPGARSRFSSSVISPAVLGFLILFNARSMCSSSRRSALGPCRMYFSRVCGWI